MIQSTPQKTTTYDKANKRVKVAIIRSNFHANLTKSMEQACKNYLVSSGIKESNIKTFEVPGSWEIPLIAKKIAELKKFDGIVVLGVVIKGETYHFEIIANECARALMTIALDFNVPIAFEVLATFNLDQAEKRAVGRLNKGIEAAKSLLETIKELSKL